MIRRAVSDNRPTTTRALRAAATVAVLALTVGLFNGSTTGQSFGKLAQGEVTAACSTSNPYLAIVCTDQAIVFQDTPGDRPHYSFGFPHGARESVIGAVWGLAYSAREHALYAAATHRRGVKFGAGGPGAIYRMDLASGAISQPITVPNAGSDRHSVDARGNDGAARDAAGKTSLGDLDLSDDERELFVVNLEDRRIYRFDIASGAWVGAFATGGDQEAWAEDARPFGLAYSAGVLYHAVVNSAESSQRERDLSATVYASRPDGSGMHAIYTTPLDQPRPALVLPSGRARTEWRAWLPEGARTRLPIVPQPIAADLVFSEAQTMTLGIKDRWGDMTFGGAVNDSPRTPGINNGDVGMPLGDVLSARPTMGGWGNARAFAVEWSRPFNGFRSNWPQGGVAALRGDVVATGSIGDRAGNFIESTWSETAQWFDAAGDRSRVEGACTHAETGGRAAGAPQRVLAARLADDEGAEEPAVLSGAPGDIELLCAPTVRPTPTPTETPLISPTPSSTRTPSPTRTQTPTPTDTPPPTVTSTPSPTRTPAPIYLPISLTEPNCVPVPPRLDIILVIDASTSMRDLTRAGRPKIDAAVAAARDFVARLDLDLDADGDHDRAAIVLFNATATLLQPLTADRAALDTALDRVALAQLTRIDLGLDAATAELTGPGRRADATAAVVLLTDGRSNPVPVSEAERAADGVKAAGARLFTIGLGQDVDREALGRMASGAKDYFEAPDGEDLAAIYGAIARALPCAPYRHWPGTGADAVDGARGR